MDKCIICGSSKLIYKKTKMSDFLVERIYGVNNVKNGVAVNLCHCLDCSFSFYDKRLTEEEERLLYKDYRGKEYQAIREKYDCWYTEKINDALNSDIHALQEQRKVIKSITQRYIKKKLNNGLDYGGNRGETFDESITIDNKYVYDISNVQTVPGVCKIENFEDLKNIDLILLCVI